MTSFNPLGGKRSLSLEAAIAALSFARESPYDAIHAQFGHLGDTALQVAKTWGGRVPVVTSFRGADTTARLSENPRIYDALFRRGDLFLPVSEDLRRRVLDSGAPAGRTFVHHSGIVLDRFKARSHETAVGALNVLFIGRFVEKKGIEYALEALALIARGEVESGDRPMEVTLTLIGSGPLEERLRTRVNELGLTDAVRFVGQQDRAGVVEWLGRSDALVVPSVTASSGDQEGIPNVAKEAMASAVPVIGTLHGGIPELIEDGVSGYLVPERDPRALAERLVLLASCPELRAALGMAGRQRVAAEFDSAKLNRDLVELYSAVVDQRLRD